MTEIQYITTTEAAKLLGISRVALYKRIKKGVLKAKRMGKFYMVPKSEVVFDVTGKPLLKEQKKILEKAIKKTIEEYGEVLKRLGNE